MRKKDPAFREFEKQTAQAFSAAAVLDAVKHDVRVRGKSGSMRQVDILISGKVGTLPIRVAVDSKLHKGKVRRRDILNILDIAEDIGASMAVVVAPNGYDKGARQLASQKGVQLLDAIDTTDTRWVNLIQFPMTFDIQFLCFGLTDEMPVEAIKNLSRLLRELWNTGRLPKEIKPVGDISENKVDTLTADIEIIDAGKNVGTMEVHLALHRLVRTGRLPLKFFGLYNPSDKEFLVPSLKTAKIPLWEILNTWEKTSYAQIPEGTVYFQIRDMAFGKIENKIFKVNLTEQTVRFEIQPINGKISSPTRAHARVTVHLEKPDKEPMKV